MCRLYGFRANEPSKVECALVLAQNSLLTQSQGDLRGSTHPDGWGIAYYENGQPEVERRETAAFEDLHFSEAAERVFARTVVAHVRSATVGANLLANTHPYIYEGWSFAHNGTVAGFGELATSLAADTDADLLELRHGTNDSEATFLWLLTRLREAGINADADGTPIEPLVNVFKQSVATLIELCEQVSPEKAARLNFLLTDGHVMVASRWNRDLHVVKRFGVHDCEICGVPHIHHHRGKHYRAVVIASEPLTHEDWQQIPQGSIVTVDRDLETRIEPMRAD
jgi:glutamine amidotransferase